MSEVFDLGAARLTVLLDVRHPFAALALQPTLALERFLAQPHAQPLVQLRARDVDWLPLTAPTLYPPTIPAADDDRGVRHRRYRAEAIAREIETYAAAQGLVLRDYYRSAESGAANLGWLWVRSRHPAKLAEYLVQLFRAYWSLALDASHAGEVAKLIDTLGADGSGFLDWSKGEGPSAAASLADALRERGLYQVPAYLVEDDVFYGRQHLEMIRWILSGRVGPGPI